MFGGELKIFFALEIAPFGHLKNTGYLYFIHAINHQLYLAYRTFTSRIVARVLPCVDIFYISKVTLFFPQKMLEMVEILFASLNNVIFSFFRTC